MAKTKEDNKGFIFRGVITATSNKQGAYYKSDNPRKTAYITVDEQYKKILLEKGFTEYTSKKDNQSFFIIKLSESITLYMGDETQEMESGVDTMNFKTKEIQMAVMQGVKVGNEYSRIYAFNLNKLDDIELMIQDNPFK